MFIELTLFRGFRILLLDGLGERYLGILLSCPQELPQPRDELIVHPLRLSALFVCLRPRDTDALRGRVLAVPVERVGSRKKIPAVVAEIDRQWVLLLRVAVALVVIPRFERRVGTPPALDFPN